MLDVELAEARDNKLLSIECKQDTFVFNCVSQDG